MGPMIRAASGIKPSESGHYSETARLTSGERPLTFPFMGGWLRRADGGLARRRLRRGARALAVLSLVGYCLFFAASMLPEWMERYTNPDHDVFGTVGEAFVFGLQVVPCLFLAVLALIPRLTELATATGAFVVLSFGVLVALVDIQLGVPSFVAGSMLIAALAIGRWPLATRT